MKFSQSGVPLVSTIAPWDEFRLKRRLELNLFAYDPMSNKLRFPQEKVDRIVDLTTKEDQELVMWMAIEIDDEGMTEYYINHIEHRDLIKMWCKTHIGDLSLREFLIRAADIPASWLPQVS